MSLRYLRVYDLVNNVDRDVSQKSEDNLAVAESELDKNTNVVAELTRKIDELQEVADEAAKLKDQLDEYVAQ